MSDGARATGIRTRLVDEQIVAWYFYAALTYFVGSLFAGLLMALQLIDHNPLRAIELFSPGRWRMVHTNAIAYGFIANAFLGALHWAVPRLTMKPVLSVPLSWFIFAAWQLVVVTTAAGLVIGPTLEMPLFQAQGVEWGETPMVIDPLAQVGLLLVAINFMAPIVRTPGPLYVSLWYFMAAFVWTFLTYAMGNFLPQYFISGSGSGAITGLFIHDLVGLFVTPIGWGLMYYFVPILLNKPIWSHGLSLVGFWGLAFFYPLQGIHHFLYTPIPMFLQYGAVISTIAVEIVVTTVIINFVGTIWGSGGEYWRSLPLRWFFTGMAFYFITCLQCAFQVTLTFQALIHFTDWVVGDAHLVMFGVFGFWILGVMTYLFPRLLKRDWVSHNLCEWHYWLTAGGMLVMFLDLMFAGIFQGYSWASLAWWDESIRISMPFWWVRVFAGLAILAGQSCFFVNLFHTCQAASMQLADQLEASSGSSL
jgi:cytochrome c oxidase cbb3-type subunit 1